MHFFNKWPVRVALFIAGFLAINAAVEFLFLEIRKESFLVMYDLDRTENVDIAFIGSSLSRTHIDNAIIEEYLEQDSFNLSANAARAAADYAMMQELFKQQTPKTVVFVSDPLAELNYENRAEPVVVEAGLRPFLHGLDIKLPYIVDNCRFYGGYLDRLFPWRTCYPANAEKFFTNLQGKLDPKGFYSLALEAYPAHDGRGHCPKYKTEQTDAHRTELHNGMTRKVKALSTIDESFLDMTLMKMKLLCQSNDCDLIVIATPQLPQVLLGDKRYDQCYEIERAICKKYDIPFWNFAYAEDELLPDMTPYFFRDEHFDKEGAEIFSSALGKVLKGYFDGEDVSHYFTTAKEYADLKSYILNGWYTESKKDQQITYTADCIYGSNVKPEYQFTAVDENGNETLLQVYYSTAKCTVSAEDMEGKTIRISIRNAEDLSQEPIIAVKK